MSWLDFFRIGRKQEKGRQEEAKKIVLKNLSAEIGVEFENLNKRIQDARQQARQGILQLNSELKGHISTLRNIGIDEKKEPERLKFIVKENLNHYISCLQKLIDELENLSIDRDYCQEPPVKDRWHDNATSQKSLIFDDYQKPKFLKLRVVLEHAQNSTSGSNHSLQTSGILTFEKISIIFENFRKNSINALEKATILIGKEIDDVRNSIKAFSESFNSIITQNKDIFEREKTASQLKNLMLRLEDEKKAGLQIENSMQNLEENLKGLEKQKLEREKRLEEIKNSSEYKELLGEKEGLRERAGELDREIFSLKQEIDIKYLSKYFHYEKKKSQILKEYAENFKSALENDDNLQIAQIIKEIKPDFDAERIKETRLKAKK
ncbi:hypothetical protein HYT92_02310, partial [Candidatus Pacearchaeota archaeon]|nr:hypothetical protein [Candidatus Pacearchaeota archaeon]